jgi:hypothetical protein
MAKKSTKHDMPAVAMEDQSWRARSDADTLRSAGEIMGDKARMAAAKSHMQQGMKAMEKVMGTAKAPASRGNGLGFAKGKR